MMTGNVGYYWREGVEEDEDGFTTMLDLTKVYRKFTFGLLWNSGYLSEYYIYQDSGSFEYWRISANLTYLFTNRLSTSINGSYGYREYTVSRSLRDVTDITAIDSNRDEYIYRAGLLINYQLFRQISLVFEYRFTEVDSNRPERYYILNHCLGRITATF